MSDAFGGVPVETDDDLIECDFGEWEGLTFAEVRERYPAQLDAWLASTAVAPPGGESFQVVSLRVRRAVKRLRATYDGRPVAVISHVTPIKLILRDALAASDAFLLPALPGPGRGVHSGLLAGRWDRGPLGERHVAPRSVGDVLISAGRCGRPCA